jgi:caspase 8
MEQTLISTAISDHKAYDCFVCCILSHGALGTVYGTNGEPVQIKDLTGHFTPTKSPTLATKPKLFFIQACQGNESQKGMLADTITY